MRDLPDHWACARCGFPARLHRTKNRFCPTPSGPSPRTFLPPGTPEDPAGDPWEPPTLRERVVHWLASRLWELLIYLETRWPRGAR